MLRFFKPRHKRYGSVEEWMDREGIKSLHHPEDPALDDRFHQQLVAMKKHHWEQHLKRLTPEERQLLETHRHPSQSHARLEEARPIFEEFQSRMKHLHYVEDAFMLLFHSNRIVFRVQLSKDVGWRVWHKQIPQFYRGFEVGIRAKVTT